MLHQIPAESFATSVSADGRDTVFTSPLTNLVPNQVTNNQNQNIFVYDNQKGTIALVNHLPGLPNTTGNGGLFNPGIANSLHSRPASYLQPVISANGNFIAFASFDSNLVPNESTLDGPPLVYVYNVQTGEIKQVSLPSSGDPLNPTPDNLAEGDPVISADGSYVAFVYGSPYDENDFYFGQQGAGVLYNRTAGTAIFFTHLSAVDLEGAASQLSMDDSGRVRRLRGQRGPERQRRVR